MENEPFKSVKRKTAGKRFRVLKAGLARDLSVTWGSLFWKIEFSRPFLHRCIYVGLTERRFNLMQLELPFLQSLLDFIFVCLRYFDFKQQNQFRFPRKILRILFTN